MNVLVETERLIITEMTIDVMNQRVISGVLNTDGFQGIDEYK